MRSDGPTPSAAAAIEGSEKYRVSVVRIGVLQRRFGHQAADGGRGRLGSLEPGQATHQAPDPAWIAEGAVYPRNVVVADRREILLRRTARGAPGQAERARPSPSAQELADVLEMPFVLRTGRIFAGEQIGDGNRPRGFTALPKAHGPHGQTGDAARSRMAKGPVLFVLFVHRRRNGATRQDEQAPPAFVDGEPDGVPEKRHFLPLVQKTGRSALQHLVGTGLRQDPVGPSLARIAETDLAFRDLPGRCRLAAPFRPLHENGAHVGQLLRKKNIRDAFSVGFRFHAR